MTKSRHLLAADLVGFGRLAGEAVAGVTGVVEAVHHRVAAAPFGLEPQAQAIMAGVPALVYNSIRCISSLVDSGLALLGRQAFLVNRTRDDSLSPAHEAVVATLNGVVGDHLARTRNPLAISMALRRQGRPLEIRRHALLSAISQPTGKLLLLAHGLCLNDLQWRRNGHDYGAALARDFGYTPVYLHYNTGLHVSENGRLLTDLIEALLDQWPVTAQELAVICHSMGGLVFRSALHYGVAAGRRWPRHLRRVVFLGVPHHGAPLERLGNWVETALQISAYSAPFARLGKIRSAGITDMRHGNLVEDDWKGRDRFAPGQDFRSPIPLPAGVESYAMAATLQQATGCPALDLLGDGLVPVNSALGRHRDPAMDLGFDEFHQWVGHGLNHSDLLGHPAVYRQIKQWFGMCKTQ